MKKVFAMLVALSLVVASVTMSVFAADVGSNETTIDNVSLGQIQDIFVDYLDEKGLPLEPMHQYRSPLLQGRDKLLPA